MQHDQKLLYNQIGLVNTEYPILTTVAFKQKHFIIVKVATCILHILDKELNIIHAIRFSVDFRHVAVRGIENGFQMVVASLDGHVELGSVCDSEKNIHVILGHEKATASAFTTIGEVAGLERVEWINERYVVASSVIMPNCILDTVEQKMVLEMDDMDGVCGGPLLILADNRSKCFGMYTKYDHIAVFVQGNYDGHVRYCKVNMLGDEIKATPKTTSGKSIVSLNEPVLQVAISDTYQLVVVGMYGKIVILEDMRLDLSKTMSRVIQSPITSRVTSSIVCQEMIYIATMQGVWEYDIQNKTGCNRMVAIDEDIVCMCDLRGAVLLTQTGVVVRYENVGKRSHDKALKNLSQDAQESQLKSTLQEITSLSLDQKRVQKSHQSMDDSLERSSKVFEFMQKINTIRDILEFEFKVVLEKYVVFPMIPPCKLHASCINVSDSAIDFDSWTFVFQLQQGVENQIMSFPAPIGAWNIKECQSWVLPFVFKSTHPIDVSVWMVHGENLEVPISLPQCSVPCTQLTIDVLDTCSGVSNFTVGQKLCQSLRTQRDHANMPNLSSSDHSNYPLDAYVAVIREQDMLSKSIVNVGGLYSNSSLSSTLNLFTSKVNKNTAKELLDILFDSKNQKKYTYVRDRHRTTICGKLLSGNMFTAQVYCVNIPVQNPPLTLTIRACLISELESLRNAVLRRIFKINHGIVEMNCEQALFQTQQNAPQSKYVQHQKRIAELTSRLETLNPNAFIRSNQSLREEVKANYELLHMHEDLLQLMRSIRGESPYLFRPSLHQQ